MESNDSPEIPDRGETSDIPGLPSRARVKTREVAVVVAVLLFVVTSGICLRIRGRRSRVTTTPNHFRLDLRLQLRSYRSGFVVLFYI